MGLAAAWEVIEANDLGPVEGTDGAVHTYDVAAVAERHDGQLHLVRTQIDMSPGCVDLFLERTRGKL